MSSERKKIEKKPVPVVEPKKRPEPEVKVIEKKPRAKPSDDKYIRLVIGDDKEMFRLIGERVARGEVTWGYYARENDKPCIYFLEIKK